MSEPRLEAPRPSPVNVGPATTRPRWPGMAAFAIRRKSVDCLPPPALGGPDEDGASGTRMSARQWRHLMMDPGFAAEASTSDLQRGQRRNEDIVFAWLSDLGHQASAFPVISLTTPEV